MYKEPIPDDHLDRALEQLKGFANVILPMLRVACEFVKGEIMQMPPGARRHDLAERELAPAFVRLRMHQLIYGHNLRCLADGGTRLKARHVRNGAVCLLQNDQEFRLLKASKRHPTRPRGYYQEGLVEQRRFREWFTTGSLFDFEQAPILDGLIYYHMWNLELKSAFVVIPDGFLPHGGVVKLREERIGIYPDLDEKAFFTGDGPIASVLEGENLVLSSEPLASDDDYNPYAADGENVLDDELADLFGEFPDDEWKEGE